MNLTFHPVTLDRWPDLDRLFSASAETGSGNPARCWCMEWRLPRAQWEAQKDEGNRRAMKGLVEAGGIPGILAYAEGEPAGWCSISPGAQLSSLRERGSFSDFDNPAVWTVICFYVRDDFQGKGLMSALLGAAIDYARGRGAKAVEGYPVDPEASPTIRCRASWPSSPPSARLASSRLTAARTAVR